MQKIWRDFKSGAFPFWPDIERKWKAFDAI